MANLDKIVEDLSKLSVLEAAVWGRSQYRRTDNRLEPYGGNRGGSVAGYL